MHIHVSKNPLDLVFLSPFSVKYIYTDLYVFRTIYMHGSIHVRRKCRKSWLSGEVASGCSTSQWPTSLMAGKMLQKLVADTEIEGG